MRDYRVAYRPEPRELVIEYRLPDGDVVPGLCFSVPAGRDVVDPVVFNGIIQGTSRATGHPEELHLVSASASREEFGGLILDQLDPAECLRHLKAIVSPHPYDLVAVEPVIEFEKVKYRFAEPVDALAGIDSRPGLLKMNWYRSEN